MSTSGGSPATREAAQHSDREIEEMVAALEWAKKSGRARFTGISSHDRPHIKRLIEKFPQQLEVICTPYTAKTKVVTDESGLWAAMKKLDVGWFGIKPFASNSLFKGDRPQSPHADEDNRIARLALRAILCNPAITAPIPGMISQQQVRQRSARHGRNMSPVSCPVAGRQHGQAWIRGCKIRLHATTAPKKNQAPLWQALRDNVLQVVSTDHCPFRFSDQKTLGLDNFTKIPNGGPGIENRMQLAYHYGVNAGRISLQRFVELTAEAPAKIFGMFPQKGIVAAGSDADLLLWDPAAKYTITAATQNMHTDYSIYEGIQVMGNARQVFSRGELIVDNGRFIGSVGRGQYLHREVAAQ